MLLDREWIEKRLKSDGILPFDETPEKHRNAYIELRAALDEMPLESKADLMEAMERCPELIETESDPIQFLRREDFNGWAAAYRLALYWSFRREAFGDRAFLSVLLTDGSGALNEADLAHIRTGYRALLPYDSEGGTVLCVEPARVGTLTVDNVTRNRSAFFLAPFMCKNPKTQTEGVVFILITRAQSVTQLEDTLSLKSTRAASPTPVELFYRAAPMRVKAMYLPQCVDDDTKAEFFKAVIPSGTRMCTTFFNTRPIPIYGDSKEQILFQLQTKAGLQKDSLPPSIGGTWLHDSFLAEVDLLDTGKGRSRSSVVEAPRDDWQSAAALMHMSTGCAYNQKRISSPSQSKSPSPIVDQQQALFGSHPSGIYDEAVEKDALARFDEAIRLIPDCDKMEYLEAVQTNPALIELESNPIRFLRTEQYNPWAAARRFVAYWKGRKDMFEERAFLPLTLDGKGALGADELELIDLRFIEQLPDDHQGRSSMAFHPSRVQGGKKMWPPKQRVRVMWYMAHCLSENDKTQTEGMYTLHTMLGPEHSEPHVWNAVHLLQHVFPIKWTEIHFLCLKPESETRSFFGPVFNFLMEFTSNLKQTVGAPQVFVHVADSKKDMLGRLETYGIGKESVPSIVGGSCPDNSFMCWKQHRLEAQYPYQVDSGKPAAKASLPPKKRSKPDTYGPESHELALKKFRSIEETHANAVPSPRPTEDDFVDDNSAVVRQGLLELEDAIRMLPNEEKEALVEARLKAPELVELESPGLRFLRFDRYNAWAAARRLASYWKTRKDFFGDRAFLPLDQTGEGALNREDVAFLTTGFVALLSDDEDGRPVVCHDSARRLSHAPEPRLRVSFYIMNVVSENEMAQKDGVVFLSVMGKPTLDQTISKGTSKIAACIPCRIKAIHLANVPSISGQKTFLDTMVPVMLQLLGKIQDFVQVHVGENKSEIASQLSRERLGPLSIPRSLGGKWGYEQFSQWQEARLRYEWKLPGGAKDSSIPPIPPYEVMPLSEMNEEQKSERKRKMNVLHSRRRRERERVEMDVFSEQAAEIREENKKLSDENKAMEELLASAKAQIAFMEQTNGQSRFSDHRSIGMATTCHEPLSSRPAPGAAMAMLLNSTVSSKGELIALDDGARQGTGSNLSFPSAAGMGDREPSSFSMALGTQGNLERILALQHLQEGNLFAQLSGGAAANPNSAVSLALQRHQQQQERLGSGNVQSQEQRSLLTSLGLNWLPGEGSQLS